MFSCNRQSRSVVHGASRMVIMVSALVNAVLSTFFSLDSVFPQFATSGYVTLETRHVLKALQSSTELRSTSSNRAALDLAFCFCKHRALRQCVMQASAPLLSHVANT